METTRISTIGQIVIPRQLREALQWGAGQELLVVQTEDGVLLKAASVGAPLAMNCAPPGLGRVAPRRLPTEEQMQAVMAEKAARRRRRSTVSREVTQPG